MLCHGLSRTKKGLTMIRNSLLWRVFISLGLLLPSFFPASALATADALWTAVFRSAEFGVVVSAKRTFFSGPGGTLSNDETVLSVTVPIGKPKSLIAAGDKLNLPPVVMRFFRGGVEYDNCVLSPKFIQRNTKSVKYTLRRAVDNDHATPRVLGLKQAAGRCFSDSEGTPGGGVVTVVEIDEGDTIQVDIGRKENVTNGTVKFVDRLGE